MAEDWIKMRCDLYRDPKVILMADELLCPDGQLAAFVNQNLQRDMTVTRNVMRNVTIGGLLSVWGVVRKQGRRENDDLVLDGMAHSVLDDIADIPGFGIAMESVGWVVANDDGLVFPRFFEENNADPMIAQRAKAAERQRKFREKNKTSNDCSNSNVTVTLRNDLEKRREEKREIPPNHLKGELPKARKDSDNTPTSPQAIRIAELFRRRPTTPWSAKEIRSYKAIGPIDPEDLELVCRYTEAERAKGDQGIHRRDLATFLNNFHGELDRARQRQTNGASQPKKQITFID